MKNESRKKMEELMDLVAADAIGADTPEGRERSLKCFNDLYKTASTEDSSLKEEKGRWVVEIVKTVASLGVWAGIVLLGYAFEYKNEGLYTSSSIKEAKSGPKFKF